MLWIAVARFLAQVAKKFHKLLLDNFIAECYLIAENVLKAKASGFCVKEKLTQVANLDMRE